ncbi:MAG: hypothetical protein QOE75_1903 [Solirubrobacterales bacterium]|nr:hypothetical protein [Solirubrobacterales bacterium]
MDAAKQRAKDFIAGGELGFDELRDLADELRKSGKYGPLAPLLIAAGRRALYGKWEPDRQEELAELMRDHQQFGYGRRLYGRVRARQDSPDLRRWYAFCVYKDMELPLARRLDKALGILREGGALAESTSAETLGVAGAIYKRRWAVDLKRADLDAAYRHYRRGFDQEGDPKAEYCGINAAFVADQIAALESGPVGQGHRWLADGIREEIVTRGGGSDGWKDATLGEALFGLGRVDDACAALARYRAEIKPEIWKRETTATQLAELGRLRGFGEENTGRALAALLGDSCEALIRRADGKVGIALSGGGFRASLFHIGVLARLAECGMLRRVEVLSCVSGGSIVGAFYYLRLRELLQAKRDAEITDRDYLELVEVVAREFLAGVRGDLRGHLFTNVLDNWKMLREADFSRSDRVADLLDKLIYSRVPKGEGKGKGPWRMTELFVTPAGSGEDFSLRYENWQRAAKVPMLVLNATTLNTGHGWQFTASWMGEPPQALDEPVDASRRLRRVYYGDAPKDHQEPRLATAVGASAAVPGLFPPVSLPGLYAGEVKGEKKIDVELVDGGVYDNQGIASLIEQDCTVVLVSDASGQAREDKRPKRGLVGVAKRSNSVLMSRVRAAQLEDLAGRQRSGALRGRMVVHMKKGLPTPPRDWDGCQEGYRETDDPFADTEDGQARYGIHHEVQRALAELRTDLDLFSDTEAYALMAAGYRMAERELATDLGELARPDPELVAAARWPFAPMLDRLGSANGLAAELRIGNALFFRRFRRWKQRLGKGAPGPLAALPGALGRGLRVGVLRPARWVAGAPLAVVGGAGSRLYLWASRIGGKG